MPQKITLIARPVESFEVPSSEGYQLYSALLNIIREVDEDISAHVHDSHLSMSLSPLRGVFMPGDRPRHKKLDPARSYCMKIGIADSREGELFSSIVRQLVLRERSIMLERGELQVERVSTSASSFEELLRSSDREDMHVDIRFISPTCIKYRNSGVYEMFPHREAVFSSLLSKWNSSCPDGFRMDIERDEMARFIIERPVSYETHSAMVNTVFDQRKGHHRPILRPGFTGRCIYTFTDDAPRDVRNGIVALSRFAEYSGIGSAVARGCGAVEVRICRSEISPQADR
ncbi:MAG: CRISPR system precrRNA processing endoribonuclease RAMP protein Cas6 [Methanothrix sp.]|nr:CRISPR system precrRNA processing endoribonuclease RAMP protein Cas6 [Methanothrix sp.]MCX8206750.1 CRISPR system precrRNA processing endoribonuclease RAMP protein Cas6 [Methanothrix sp.]